MTPNNDDDDNQSPSDNDGGSAGPNNSSGAGVESGVSDFQIGGLAGKKKQKTKVKKMKLGGVASRE